MKKTNKNIKHLAITIVLAFMPCYSALAQDNYLLYNQQGKAVFDVRFFGKDDGFGLPWTVSPEQEKQVLDGIQYWAEVLNPKFLTSPAIIEIGTDTENNAFGNFLLASPNEIFNLSKLQAIFTGKDAGDPAYGCSYSHACHGRFTLGQMDFDDLVHAPSQLPRTTKVDLSAVVTHEIAHVLGMINMAGSKNGDVTKPYFFNNKSDSWVLHLRDDNGNPAQLGQAILCSLCTNAYDPKAFDLRQNKGYFAGTNVSEVLGNAMPGVPVTTLVEIIGDVGIDFIDKVFVDSDYMSHSELTNSLMSHQIYRNYTTFMEAELAMLQDMGYTIDRRNFYGYSIYADGQTLVNTHGYFLRNAEGTAYITGQYNTATLGLGLHIYGSHNTVTQAADLLAKGDGAAGVRIDGVGNTFIVSSGTKIHADGLNGRGIMFTYGKNHNFVQRGDVEALGTDGIGVSFDFGNNAMGNEEKYFQYRGSYILQVSGKTVPLSSKYLTKYNLDGALVNNADISGRIAGSEAAIYISANALVGNINVLSGAKLQGDIISEYNQYDENNKQRLTNLSFGKLADENGRSTTQADAGFRMRYDGNIKGINNLALSIDGGYSSLNGQHELYKVDVAAGATLAGNSSYLLNNGNFFSNYGTVSPGNSIGRIDIYGNYYQADSGNLLIEINNSGAYDILNVNGYATLGGKMTLVPMFGWYENGWTIQNAKPLQATSIIGAFSTIDTSFSPTLTLSAVTQANNSYKFTMTRKSDAYQQYATSTNASEVGAYLDHIVGEARNDIQPLFTYLDFSAKDGSTISAGLTQLSPASYSAIFASTLNQEHQISSMLDSRNFYSVSTQLNAEKWNVFAIPFGGKYKQESKGTTIGYDSSNTGILFGAEIHKSNWTFGAHGVVSEQSININSSDDSNEYSYDVGVHARYQSDPKHGAYFFGQARIGINEAKITRNVNIGNYHTQNKASWNGSNSTLFFGSGYRFMLNNRVSLGPVISLDYTNSYRQNIRESGSDATRLSIESTNLNSLQSSLGIRSEISQSFNSSSAYKVGVQLAWEHDFLSNELKQTANFVGYADSSFDTKNKLSGSNSLNTMLYAKYDINKRTSLGANMSMDLFRSGYNSFAGNISATWKF